jgi:hypothetical protein
MLAAVMEAWPALAAQAAELPLRKPGLWEMNLVRTGTDTSLPALTMQHCTDETTDKDMATASSPLSNEICSKHDLQQTATGYVSDSICTVAGVSITNHSEITGDFNSAYTVKTATHSERPVAGLPKDVVTTIQAKWLGACKPGQKPGDIVMPGGFKLNIKDAEKLKNLIPGGK